MPLFKQLSQDEIEQTYTHYATLFGVPIYFNKDTNEVCTRNWVPEFLLDVAQGLHDTAEILKHNPNQEFYQQGFLIKQGKRIERKGGDRGRHGSFGA